MNDLFLFQEKDFPVNGRSVRSDTPLLEIPPNIIQGKRDVRVRKKINYRPSGQGKAKSFRPEALKDFCLSN